MNWSRAKTIFICIFVFVNIFLIVMYRFYYTEPERMDTEKLISILKNNNITLSNTALAESVVSPSVRTMAGVEIVNRLAYPEEIVNMFLGSGISRDASGTYKKGSSQLSISNTETEYKNSAPQNKDFSSVSEINVGNKVIDELNKKGIRKDTLSLLSSHKISDLSFRVILSYKFGDFIIFNNNITVSASTEGITALRGPQLSFSPIQNREYSIISRESLLLEFINNNAVKEGVPIHITAITLGYFLPENQFDVSADAIPAYAVKTDDKRIFYYDARAGISHEIRLLKNEHSQ